MVRPGEINLRVYPTEQTIKEGREVVFQCRDEGTLRARVAWRRGNGLGLPYGTRDVNGRLEMPNIKMMDTGTYVCYALEYSAELSVYLRVEQAVIPTTRPPTSCQLYQATCNNGDCIDRSQVCNGVIDCADGSDESGCRASNECEPNEYQCENKKCVLKTWRCDGDDDCGDGTDEQNCQETDPSNPCRFYECSV
ncbi:basement membrane proteoglycan [Eurytemora carolleeae]|uniref:basement membrane proteoglycan n=1 Tax=Eurytemora carolleeae TaxID=1294199 RepID=UPI000C76D46E|nr:basement membrane proteoglycan [Eurytemora carolleeae]|eukprot:XP_023321610.1 basement membrane proteoglycan-like [Eurytemora affinis]